jgi:hypothetical protein
MLAPARYLADFARFAATKGTQERHDLQALAELEARPLELPAGHDDFFRPLDAPLGLSTNVHLAEVPDEIAAVSAASRVTALPLLAGAAR